MQQWLCRTTAFILCLKNNQIKQEVILVYTSKLPVISWTKKNIYSRIKKKRFSDQKKRFLVAILKLSDETGSRFFEPLDFKIHYHRTWKFAIKILKISQLNLDYLTKNRFSAAFLNFYDLTGRNFFLNYRFYKSLPSNLNICH